MKDYKVLKIQKSVYEDNDKEAEIIREDLKEKGVFLINLMSSPGSGKTTTVVRTIEALRDEMNIGIIEADIDSDVDAETVAKTGTKVIQLNTGGACHLDAGMTKEGLDGLGIDQMDLVILENIGNLICPAGFDTGSSKNVMILSVPEGDDKPLKYPKMFRGVDVLLINKIDAIEYFDFNFEALDKRVKELNPHIKIIPMSAKTGQGVEEWTGWIREQVKIWKMK